MVNRVHETETGERLGYENADSRDPPRVEKRPYLNKIRPSRPGGRSRPDLCLRNVSRNLDVSKSLDHLFCDTGAP
jgi:hypothetical protein